MPLTDPQSINNGNSAHQSGLNTIFSLAARPSIYRATRKSNSMSHSSGSNAAPIVSVNTTATTRLGKAYGLKSKHHLAADHGSFNTAQEVFSYFSHHKGVQTRLQAGFEAEMVLAGGKERVSVLVKYKPEKKQLCLVGATRDPTSPFYKKQKIFSVNHVKKILHSKTDICEIMKNADIAKTDHSRLACMKIEGKANIVLRFRNETDKHYFVNSVRTGTRD